MIRVVDHNFEIHDIQRADPNDTADGKLHSRMRWTEDMEWAFEGMQKRILTIQKAEKLCLSPTKICDHVFSQVFNTYVLQHGPPQK